MTEALTLPAVIIEGVELYWPNLYDPQKMQGQMSDETYGFAIAAEHVPIELHPFVNFRAAHHRTDSCSLLFERHCNSFATFRQRWKPQIVFKEGNRHGADQVDQLRRFCATANIRPDQMFDAIKADIVVRPFEYEKNEPRRPRTVKTNQIMAVRVAYTDMLARYDLACARFWE